MRYTTGNLLDVPADALVNTVNTMGVMGKGIALMFKEKFPENFRLYEEACEAGRVEVGHLMITEGSDMYGPRWIVNFPTKKHWRHPSRLEWIESGLKELRKFIESKGVKSIAIPPLGAGNGGLDWIDVRAVISRELENLKGVDVVVFEPTSKYQNVAKRLGVEKLTPARALIAEMIRRYWVLGLECTLLEVQKLAWFVQANISKLGLEDPLKLNFKANRFGPYADVLRHMLDALDGSYLQSDKRISDATAFDIIRFNDAKRQQIEVYFTSPEAKPFRAALQATSNLIDGFESPLGMELLATIDWLIRIERVPPTLEAVTVGIKTWPGGVDAARRKEAIFERRLIEIALERLTSTSELQPAQV